MVLRDVGLYLLVVLSLGSVASAQGGFSAEEAFGSFGGLNSSGEGDYLSFDSFDVPWYSYGSSSSFEFNSSYQSSYSLNDAYSFFDEYYFHSGSPIVGGIISAPVKFEITQRVPARVYFGSGRAVTYTQYASALSAVKANELWIQGASDWSQYIVCPVGTWLQLVANAPMGGSAEFYEMTQTAPGQVSVTYKQYQFYPGYNSMSFNAASAGRHILLFVLNNQPSTAVIVDVAQPQMQTAATTTAAGSSSPVYSGTGPLSGQAYTSSSTQTYSQTTGQALGGAQYSSQQSASVATSQPVPVPAPTQGDTPVTIQTSLRGYQVFLDGAYIGTEGIGGDAPDGVYRFSLTGGQTHEVRIFDGQNYYGKPMYFERGVPKAINVPPAATVYF